MLAATVDGKIAKSKTHLASWTSKEDKMSFIKETKKAGVIIMGRSTFATIGKPLPGRLNIILTSSPEKFKEEEKRGILEFIKGSPLEVVSLLKRRGYTLAILGGGANTNAKFLEAGLVDELLITVEPKIFGSGVDLFAGSFDVDLELLNVSKLNKNTIQLRYRVIK